MKTRNLFRNILYGSIIGCLAMLVSPASFAQEKKVEGKSLVKYRQIFMDTKAKHNLAIRLLTRKGKRGKLSIPATDRIRQIVIHAEALEKMAPEMNLLFPPGTRLGKSRALSKIWDKNGNVAEEFRSLSGIMAQASKELVATAKQGNMKTIQKQAAELALSCRGCHTEFRGE